MPQLHVNALKNNVGGYSRGYLFNVYFLIAPVNITGPENKTVYLVRSTNLPESTIDQIEVPWQGQLYKFGSTHAFTDWTCTFNLDNAADLRKEMLKWQGFVHNPTNNVHGLPDLYFGEILVELIDINGNKTMDNILHQAWPMTVGALELSHDNKDVSQFDVTFVYNWHDFS